MHLRFLLAAALSSPFALSFACGGASSAAHGDVPAQRPASGSESVREEQHGSTGSSGETTGAVASSATAAPAPVTGEGTWPFVAEASVLERLAKDPGPQKSNWTPPGKGERYGHAEGLVSAPQADVKKRLVDFAHYKDLAGPKFKQVRVVGKEGDATDVYFQLPIMKGLVTIWYVTRFAPARTVGNADVVEGTFVKGNIKGMHIVLKVQPGPDEKTSAMVCDLLLTPGLPAPQSALDEELRDACGDAINSVRRLTTAP